MLAGNPLFGIDSLRVFSHTVLPIPILYWLRHLARSDRRGHCLSGRSLLLMVSPGTILINNISLMSDILQAIVEVSEGRTERKQR